MNKTAVDFLKEKLTYVFVNDKSFNELFQQAKAMEKEQIIEAVLSNCYIGGATEEEAEQYYNETFNQ